MLQLAIEQAREESEESDPPPDHERILVEFDEDGDIVDIGADRAGLSESEASFLELQARPFASHELGVQSGDRARWTA
jgi:hypothetical protein